MGPAASLAGRDLGMDFAGKDGWRMYHGDVVPGFPRHPHRGFETITLARNGYIDHSDSLGATARFGHGDAQWMTAGQGIVHSEMFPLVHRDRENPTELFQIWLNLPARGKLVPPHFTMLWDQTIPKPAFADAAGRTTEVAIIAGAVDDHRAPNPPPHSWAADPDANVAVWTLRMEAQAEWTLPPAQEGSHRALYFFAGESVSIDDEAIAVGHRIDLVSHRATRLRNGDRRSELLLLQGQPINEPVAHYGPFVMNTQGEIRQAITDYQRTGFGGWPWKSDGPVHPRSEERFAIHADGRREVP